MHPTVLLEPGSLQEETLLRRNAQSILESYNHPICSGFLFSPQAIYRAMLAASLTLTNTAQAAKAHHDLALLCNRTCNVLNKGRIGALLQTAKKYQSTWLLCCLPLYTFATSCYTHLKTGQNRTERTEVHHPGPLTTAGAPTPLQHYCN
jgi:hypothetical protein